MSTGREDLHWVITICTAKEARGWVSPSSLYSKHFQNQSRYSRPLLTSWTLLSCLIKTSDCICGWKVRSLCMCVCKRGVGRARYSQEGLGGKKWKNEHAGSLRNTQASLEREKWRREEECWRGKREGDWSPEQDVNIPLGRRPTAKAL